MDDMMIENAKRFAAELFEGNSDGHDMEHTLRVYRSAMRIAEAYPGCDRVVVALAALLHDADDHKLFGTEGQANSRRFLDGQGIGGDTAERICGAIAAVSFSKNRGRVPESLEAKIVQDADRLDAIGAVGIARTFAYGGRHGRTLGQTAEHFREKLLLIKDELNTPEARAEAEERHAFMVDFLERLGRETGDTYI